MKEKIQYIFFNFILLSFGLSLINFTRGENNYLRIDSNLKNSKNEKEVLEDFGFSFPFFDFFPFIEFSTSLFNSYVVSNVDEKEDPNNYDLVNSVSNSINSSQEHAYIEDSNELSEFHEFGNKELSLYSDDLESNNNYNYAWFMNPINIFNSLTESFNYLNSVFDESSSNSLKDNNVFVNPEVEVTKDKERSECLITIDVGDLPDSSSLKVTVDKSNLIEVTYTNTEHRSIPFDSQYSMFNDFPSLRGNKNRERNAIKSEETKNYLKEKQNEVKADNKTDSSLEEADYESSNDDFSQSHSVTITGISMKQHQLPDWCDASSLDGKATMSEDNKNLFIKFPLLETQLETQSETSQEEREKDIQSKEEEHTPTSENLEETECENNLNEKSEIKKDLNIKVDNFDEKINSKASNYSFNMPWNSSRTKNAETLHKKREIPIVSFEEF